MAVGGTTTFRATTNLADPAYRWCRTPPNGAACIPIPGATGAAYAVEGAALADDGSQFMVTATGSQGTASSGFARLAVSSMPGVEFRDGEFADADWAISVVENPLQGGASFTALRTPAGGNPGAARTATYDLPSPARHVVRHFYTALRASYAPAGDGAIYLVDFAEDCLRTLPAHDVSTMPLIEQGGRRYVAPAYAFGCPQVTAWGTVVRPSLRAEDFMLADGPACGAGESCPDFSATAAPLRFGLVGEADRSNAPAGGGARFTHTFDNWAVTVWRR